MLKFHCCGGIGRRCRIVYLLGWDTAILSRNNCNPVTKYFFQYSKLQPQQKYLVPENYIWQQPDICNINMCSCLVEHVSIFDTIRRQSQKLYFSKSIVQSCHKIYIRNYSELISKIYIFLFCMSETLRCLQYKPEKKSDFVSAMLL